MPAFGPSSTHESSRIYGLINAVALLIIACPRPARNALAPALAKVDVGGAIGAGTDATMNSAQVMLMNGDLRGIARRG